MTLMRAFIFKSPFHAILKKYIIQFEVGNNLGNQSMPYLQLSITTSKCAINIQGLRNVHLLLIVSFQVKRSPRLFIKTATHMPPVRMPDKRHKHPAA